MKRYKVIFYIFIIVIFNSCKTDFDVTAPYKETMVVYGLLNAGDTVQWVRINKAFLGDGNAYVMAQQPDSINYPDILNVNLEEYNDAGMLLKSIQLTRDSSIQKEPGIFATAPNILYRTNSNDRIRQQNKYKLVAYNRESGKTATATTDIVDSIFLTYPYVDPNFQINWYQPAAFTVRWTTVPEGVDYQLTIRFHYDEISLSNPSDIHSKYIDWIFPDQSVPLTGQATQLAQLIAKDDFYFFVKNSVAQNNDVKRRIGVIDFMFTVAANEFYTYIQVNHPPTGINQNIPQYTNIDGGLGIFSSRLSQAFPNFLMHQQSKDSLRFGSITGDLNFVLN